MSKKYKDKLEIRLIKRKDDAIQCFNDILAKATKRLLFIDDELRLMATQLENQLETDRKEFDGELKKQTDQIEEAKLNLEHAEGLNKKLTQEEVFELSENLIDYIDFILSRVERNVKNFNKASIDAKKQIEEIVTNTLETISNIWSTTRDKMELIYRKAAYYIGPKSGKFEDMIGLMDIKIREIQAPLPGLAQCLLEKQEPVVMALNNKFTYELEYLEMVKQTQVESFENYLMQNAKNEDVDDK